MVEQKTKINIPSKSLRGQVLYFDVLELAPLFNHSLDPNIKIKDLTPMIVTRPEQPKGRIKNHSFSCLTT
jgi:hypothetical protein